MSHPTLQWAKLQDNSYIILKSAYDKLNGTDQTDVVPAHSMKGSERMAPLILNLNTRWR